jgi:hypothetical protein
MYYNFFDIIITIILIALLIYKLFHLLFSRNRHPQIDNFEDINIQTTIPETTTSPTPTPQFTPPPMPTEVDIKCTADYNVVGYCLNYNGCCSQNTLNNTCFCNHPLVQKCKSAYDECTSNQNKDNKDNKDSCKDTLKSCCLDYNKINIDISNFNKPIKQEQQSKIICSVSGIKNIDQKCMELCQTTPECKSFGVDTLNCMLFNDIDPIQQKKGIKPITDYYIKKT